jgi:hypothetical protein
MTLHEVRPAAAFTDEPEHPGSSREPFLHLLTQVTESGHVSDNFRIAITAPQEVTFTFKGSAVFSHVWFGPYTFSYTVAAASIEFAVNRLTTEWENVSELVSAGKIVTTREDEGEPFLTVWRHHEKDASHPAASVRFAVIVNDASKFELILEGLPAEAGRLHGLPVLRKDNSAAIQLGQVNLAHEGDGAAERGAIKPRLYSNSPAASAQAVASHPGEFYRGLRLVWNRFFTPETLGQAEAATLVRTPREGAAHHPLGLQKTRAEQKEPEPEPGPSSGHKRGKRNLEPSLKKYNDKILDSLDWMKNEKLLNANMRARISAGLAEKSWGKHSTVWRIFNQFAGTRREGATWPLSDATVLEFASWCDEKRHLSANTIRSYIQSLSKIQKMRGGPHISVNKVPFLKEFLAGVQHEPRKKMQKRKLVVSFPFLQVLGHWAGREASWTAF